MLWKLPVLLFAVAVTFDVSAALVDITDGTSNTITAPAPGPIAGAGLPGLIAICVGVVAWARSRKRSRTN